MALDARSSGSAPRSADDWAQPRVQLPPLPQQGQGRNAAWVPQLHAVVRRAAPPRTGLPAFQTDSCLPVDETAVVEYSGGQASASGGPRDSREAPVLLGSPELRRQETLAKAARERLPLKVRPPPHQEQGAQVHLLPGLPAKKKPLLPEATCPAFLTLRGLDSMLPVKKR
ncbi:unnamed protein product, partial [Polarella glacialis]